MLQVKRAFKAIGLTTAGVCMLLVASAINAADQFWVSLGSYGQLSGAEAMRDRAGATFSALQIVPTDTPVGFVYRVVEGPMTTRTAANERLDQARVAGFIDAWLLTQDSSVPMGSLGSSDAGYSAGGQSAERYSETYSYDDSSSYETTSDYASSYSSSYSEGENQSAPSSDDYDAVAIGTEELVETAPEGYGLHRLERSTQTLPPGAAAESRLSELRTDPK